MSKHQWQFFDFDSKARCIGCGWTTKASVAQVNASRCMGALTTVGPATGSDVIEAAVMKIPVRTGIDPAGGAASTVVVRRAADFSDKPSLAGSQWTPQEIQAIETAREIRAEIDKACGLPPFGKIERKIDLRSEALRHFVDSKTGRKYIAIELYDRVRKLADDVARDASRSGVGRELRERAERAAGRVTAVNFTKAAPDEAIVTHLCEIVERLAGTDVAQLDQENARLRRELAEVKQSRDGWQGQARTLMSLTAGLRKRLGEREDNVTYVEPFPDVDPYAGDWIPPSHKPRILP